LCKDVGIMNLIDQTNMLRALSWLRDAKAHAHLNKREACLVDLALVLIDECTPYLGSHDKVERALREFGEMLCDSKDARKRRSL